jgi:hypothetical protein
VTLAIRSEYVEFSPADGGPDSGMADGPADGTDSGTAASSGDAAEPREPRSGRLEGLAAVITGKRFAAGQLRITAELRGGGTVTASRHGIDSHLRIGQEVRVHWPAARAVLVDRDGWL